MPAAQAPLAVDALVFDAYGTLFDVHSITVGGRAPAAGERDGALAAVAHEAARVHVAAEPDGRAGVSARGLRRGDGQGARLRRGGVAPCAARGRTRRAPRGVPDAVAVRRRCARRWRRWRRGPAGFSPTARSPCWTRWCATPGSPPTSTACSRSTPPASTSPARASTSSPSTACGLPPAAHRLRVVERLGRDRRQGVRLHGVLDQSHRRAGRPARPGARPRHREPRRPAGAARVTGLHARSGHVLAAVDLDHLARDVAGQRVRREVEQRTRAFVGAAEAVHRDRRLHRLQLVGASSSGRGTAS